MSPRRANPEAREALVAAARQEFARRGVQGARIEEIARRAGLSKGAFYLHFDGKETVFREILQRFLGVLAELAARREERVRQAARDLTSALEIERQADLELLEALWRNRKVVAALEGCAVGTAAGLAQDFRRGLRALLSSRLEDWRQSGWLRDDLAPAALGDILLGAHEAFGRRMVELAEKPDLTSWARALHATFYEGVLSPRHRPGADGPSRS